MCGRYILIDNIKSYEKRFNAVAQQYSARVSLPNFNVVPGALAPVITNDKPNEIQFFILDSRLSGRRNPCT
ncbi:MAG: hypothetical protein IPK10_09715 [Bacteroidetes bacterium]|nr:hypothetical protein [Bacteroidota bacterium]